MRGRRNRRGWRDARAAAPRWWWQQTKSARLLSPGTTSSDLGAILFLKIKAVFKISFREFSGTLETHRDLHVDLDGFALLEAQVQLLLRFDLFLLDLLLVLDPLEVVLQGDVQVERVGPVAEAEPDERVAACRFQK